MDRLAEPRYNSLFASHRQWLDLVRRSYQPHLKAGATYQRLSILKQGVAGASNAFAVLGVPRADGISVGYEPLDKWMAHRTNLEGISKGHTESDDQPLEAVDVALIRGQRIRLGEGSLRHDVSAMEPAFGPADVGKMVLIDGNQVICHAFARSLAVAPCSHTLPSTLWLSHHAPAAH